MDVSALWVKYKETKDVEIRNELAENYLPLVKIICGRLAISLPAHLDKDDLLSSGFFGLLDAIERFDLTRNIKFETYAGVRIRGAMLDYLRSQDWISVSLRQKIRTLEQTILRLENELGRAATERELAEGLGIRVEELERLISQSNSATLVPLEEYLIPEKQDKLEFVELKESLAFALKRLPEKELMVITLYYYEGLTLKEISLVMHLTEARISQLHTKAILRLRSYFNHEP